MPPSDLAAAAHRVSWRVGYRWIVRDVTLEAPRGRLVLLVGGNGAGKTTLLRLFAGLMRPSAGQIVRHAAVGLVAHHTMLYDALTARENLRFFARLHGVHHAGHVDAVLDRLGLAPAADQRIAGFSRGMLQRLAIARALLHDPALLLLDEPLSGLDESGAAILVRLIRELKGRGHAVLAATHQLVEVVAHADAIGYIAGGRLLACEPPPAREAGAVIDRYRELAARVA
jgi:ABC-type multidrug transport system ATPase subunit